MGRLALGAMLTGPAEAAAPGAPAALAAAALALVPHLLHPGVDPLVDLDVAALVNFVVIFDIFIRRQIGAFNDGTPDLVTNLQIL